MFFAKLYARVMQWSRHERAIWYLAGLSFAESSFFPIPPDVMLVPMAMATPLKAWFFAVITTFSSVIGGILGYILGWCLFEFIHPILIHTGYISYYQEALVWFNHYGFWAVVIAGFTPIPYKVFTIAAGSLHMAIVPFVLASIIGRGGRFFLIALLMRYGGVRMEQLLLKFIDHIAIALVLIAITVIIIWYSF